ncbi:ABC transporter ATP-binding protein [Acidianus manzaensis]|uniref:ABC transporter ATP-binding protein n=1 Tax=Acidianus manzaensis TaxID=282676 RepID=A0A1W6JXH6_9CREN|nr:ABC transporter ATP-binding protein [Acidianus manzaensis]ARM74945.1 ABC transporter ATP-binding protein [Acidianus manzaensis]
MITIKVKDLWKSYGKKDILKGISFEVNEGEIFSLLGPNGAGKTTTVKVLSCMISPSKGEVEVLGYKIPKECSNVRKIVGIVPQEFQGFSDLTVRDNIAYFSKLYGGNENQIDEIIEKLDLKNYEKVRYKNLSGGYKRRVAIAIALVGNPKIIYLDEPTVGLDPKSRRNIWEIMKDLKNKNLTVLLTTHYLDEAQKLSDKIAIVYDGKILRLTTPDGLMKEFEKSSLEEAYLALLETLGEQ